MNSVFLPTQVSSGSYRLDVPFWERWRICRRLLELGIPSVCTSDGGLQVEVNTLLAALQVRSVVQQYTARRSELVQTLEACWQLPMQAGGQDGQVA
ncbi:MAG: Asr1405/Asl0597 family protein [Cyanobacteriota bacterium]